MNIIFTPFCGRVTKYLLIYLEPIFKVRRKAHPSFSRLKVWCHHLHFDCKILWHNEPIFHRKDCHHYFHIYFRPYFTKALYHFYYSYYQVHQKQTNKGLRKTTMENKLRWRVNINGLKLYTSYKILK